MKRTMVLTVLAVMAVAGAVFADQAVEMVVGCPTTAVTANTPILVDVSMYNYDCTNPVSVGRLSKTVMGSGGTTLGGYGIWGPYNRGLSTTRVLPAATCSGSTVTPGTPQLAITGLPIMNAPSELVGKMGTVVIEAVSTDGRVLGSGECYVEVK